MVSPADELYGSVGSVSDVPNVDETGIPRSDCDIVQSEPVPTEARQWASQTWQIDNIRQTWLDLLHDVESKSRATVVEDEVQRTVAQSLLDEANNRVYQFRRDVARLFLFMMKATVAEFPLDVLTSLRGPIDNAMTEVQEDIRRLRTENNKLRGEILEATRKLNEFTILWNNAAIPMKGKK